MNFRKLRYLSLLLSVFVVSACTDETPTDVGDDLIPSGDVRTFEVILDAASFLTFDTTFSGYTRAAEAPFAIIANQFGGVLDANMLLELGLLPRVLAVRNTAGNVVADSAPIYFGARLVVRIDTIRSDTEPPARFALAHIGEPWDASATWTLRVDTGNVQLPWATPGGTRGAQIDTTTWTAGDTMVFRVDSTTLAQWADTTNSDRGVLISALTANSRIRVNSAVLRVSARSTVRPDTVFNVDVVPTLNRFIFNPAPPPPAGQLRVGGVPSWRTLLGLREDLGSIILNCPDGTAGCSVRLDQAHINRAELLLQPAVVPAGFLPEDTTLLQARALLRSAGVPLERSPIGNAIGVSDPLAPDWFRQPAATAPVAVNLTSYIIALLDEDIEAANRPSFNMVLHAAGEPITFGFASFAPSPKLRLVVTAPVERAQ